jgi:DNA-binding transcriptional LysR family regulator
MTDFDTALLRTFVVLAETAHFSQAADIVGRTQSAVSAQIRRLEALVGRRLVDRTTRHVALTADGERFLVHARRVLAAADEMFARFRDDEVTGRVGFGSPEDFASFYLPPVLSAFAADHPGVELTVACRLTLPLIEAVAERALDVAIIKQDPAAPVQGAQPLWREALVWVGADAEIVPPSGARPVPLVLSPAPCVYRARAVQCLAKAGRPWRSLYTSPSFAGALAAVRAGLGVTVMPEAMVPEDLEVLSGLPDLPEAEISLIVHPLAGQAARVLADYLVNEMPKRRAAPMRSGRQRV